MKPNFYPFSLSKTAASNGSGMATRALAAFLLSGMLGMSLPGYVLAQTMDVAPLPRAVHGQIAINHDVAIAPSNLKVSLNLRNAELSDVLNLLAQQGKFNLLMDDTVKGQLSIDIKNVSINKALEYIFTMEDLSFSKDGNTVIVASRDKIDSNNLNSRTFKAIPVLYKSVDTVAAQLNNILQKMKRPGSNGSALTAFDKDSNSLLVMGTDADVKLIGDTLRQLDVPRNRKVYHIMHSTPGYVASILSANFFTSLGGGSISGGSSGSSGSSGGSSSGSSGSSASSGSSSGSSSSGSSSGSSSSSSGTSGSSGSSGATTAGLASTTSGGVTFISEPISGTLTVLGTDEQIALIDSLIGQIDVRRPQAEIEVSLVEIKESMLKSLVPALSNVALGRHTNLSFLGNVGNVIKYNRTPLTSDPQLFNSLSFTNNNSKTVGKVIANPTIVALDGQDSTIAITDQVANISTTVTVTNGISQTTSTITMVDAGVTLSITPTIMNDGSVTLKLSPEVSQPDTPVSSPDKTVVAFPISKRSVTIAAARVQDGDTLVIGGLLKETNRKSTVSFPGLDRLPIVSAIFRATNNNDKDRTELVLMVTPHIIHEEGVPYFMNRGASQAFNPNDVKNPQPAPLPRYMAPQAGDANTGRINAMPTSSENISPAGAHVKVSQGTPEPANLPVKAPDVQSMLMMSDPAAKPVKPASTQHLYSN